MKIRGNGFVGGAFVALAILAFAARTHCAVAAEPSARESHPGLDVRYESVAIGPGRSVQTVTTLPRGATNLPRIVFIPWLSCDAADYPKGPGDGWGRMLFDLARNSGAALVRVEKTGMGAGNGPKCADADLDADLAGFRAGITHALAIPEIDRSRVFLMGGSIGASLAPGLARGLPLAGIVVTGGHYKTWLEHMLEIERRRLRLSGSAPDKVNDAMRGYADFYSLYLNGPMTPAAVLTKRPDLKPLWNDEPERQYGRPARYYQQLQSLDIASTWDAVRVPVLVIYGEYDWIMSRDDQDLIVATVNHNRPGTATLVVVPKMDHHIALYESPEKAFREEGGRYASLVAEEIRRWIASVKPALR